jgi:hypothetical protein
MKTDFVLLLLKDFWFNLFLIVIFYLETRGISCQHYLSTRVDLALMVYEIKGTNT